VVAALSDLPHQKIFGFYFLLGNLSLEKQQELWSKTIGAFVKGSRSFCQSQQELWSKAVGALVKSNRSFRKSSKSNGIGRREGED